MMTVRDGLLIGLAAFLGFAIGFVVGSPDSGVQDGGLRVGVLPGLVIGLLLASVVALVLGLNRRAAGTDPDVGGPDAARALAVELERARRFARPLTLVRVRPAGASAGGGWGDVDRAWFERRLRAVDYALQDGTDLLLMLPETTGDQADRLIARLAEETIELRHAATSVASFPADGLTSGALFELLYRPGVAARSVRDVNPEV